MLDIFIYVHVFKVIAFYFASNICNIKTLNIKSRALEFTGFVLIKQLSIFIKVLMYQPSTLI